MNKQIFKKSGILVISHIIILLFLLPVPVYAQNRVLWKVDVGVENLSQVAIGEEGTIYVASDRGYLHAFDLDGHLKWRFKANHWRLSTPVIDKEGTIYFLDEEADFYALKKDGSLKWSTNIGERGFISPAVGSRGTIYISSLNKNFYAFNKDGSLKWQHDIDGWGRRNPVVWHDGTIYTTADNGESLLALTPEGKRKWEFNTKGKITSPAIGPLGTIYFGDTGDYFYAVDPEGILKWREKFKYHFTTGPIVGRDGIIYVTNGRGENTLYALKPDGSILWEAETEDFKLQTPAIANNGTIYTGSRDGHNVFAFNQDGTLKWKQHVDSEVNSSPQIGEDGTVYIATEDSTYALRGSSTGPMNSSWPLCGQNVRNTSCQTGFHIFSLPDLNMFLFSRNILIGTLLGFLIGFTIKKSIKIILFGIGLILIIMIVLSKYDVLVIQWSQIEMFYNNFITRYDFNELLNRVYLWFGNSIPVAGSFGFGFLIGLKTG